jgi:hypothetical protein
METFIKFVKVVTKIITHASLCCKATQELLEMVEDNIDIEIIDDIAF